jgi:hypothetical protein
MTVNWSWPVGSEPTSRHSRRFNGRWQASSESEQPVQLGTTPQPQLVELRDNHRGFAYASQRGRGGYHLTVAGRSGEDILAVIEKLRDVNALVGPGLVASVD